MPNLHNSEKFYSIKINCYINCALVMLEIHEYFELNKQLFKQMVISSNFCATATLFERRYFEMYLIVRV